MLLRIIKHIDRFSSFAILRLHQTKESVNSIDIGKLNKAVKEIFLLLTWQMFLSECSACVVNSFGCVINFLSMKSVLWAHFNHILYNLVCNDAYIESAQDAELDLKCAWNMRQVYNLQNIRKFDHRWFTRVWQLHERRYRCSGWLCDGIIKWQTFWR